MEIYKKRGAKSFQTVNGFTSFWNMSYPGYSSIFTRLLTRWQTIIFYLKVHNQLWDHADQPGY